MRNRLVHIEESAIWGSSLIDGHIAYEPYTSLSNGTGMSDLRNRKLILDSEKPPVPPKPYASNTTSTTHRRLASATSIHGAVSKPLPPAPGSRPGNTATADFARKPLPRPPKTSSNVRTSMTPANHTGRGPVDGGEQSRVERSGKPQRHKRARGLPRVRQRSPVSRSASASTMRAPASRNACARRSNAVASSAEDREEEEEAQTSHGRRPVPAL